MKVLKFGGSSVGTPGKIKDVKQIIESADMDMIIVVSAFRGITDQLIRICQLASNRNDTYQTELDELKTRHLQVIAKLMPPELEVESRKELLENLDDLGNILRGIYLLRELSLKTQDAVLSYGEKLAALLMSKIIHNAEFFDIRKSIITDDNFGSARINFEKTNQLIQQHLKTRKGIVIVPGFTGSTESGETTTLGRGGSDYTASIIAAAIDASALEIWTDVDGFMTADPKKVEKAYAIDSLTYSEAIELSHFGAKVIYTPTLRPVYMKDIPLVIKNTFNPLAKGTLITNVAESKPEMPVKGISSIDHIDLLTLQGTAMVGVSGTSHRLFGALASENVNIILITQASSEYSITFAVNPESSEKAKKAILKEFNTEINIRKELRLNHETELSVIAIVGEGMKNTPGISANLFRSLGRNGISAIATAQGSSELNISVVIKQQSLKKALNVIHEGFFLSGYKELHLFVVGTGGVGKSLLTQVALQQEKLMKNHKLKVNLVGIANSRKMLIEKTCLQPETAIDSLDKLGGKVDLQQFVTSIVKLNLRNSVFIDCTASEDVAAQYMSLLDAFISVVTANKIASSSDYDTYFRLKKTALEKNARFIFETNVGAGLPIINTINDLIRSGDRILKLEAVLSGTLNFIFNELGPDVPLSKAIKMAKEAGFSEPDPRVDLSGADVVRKLLILARESGYRLEKEDVVIKPFLPADCFDGSIDEFWYKVEKYDVDFEARRKDLEKQNKKWRFFALFDNGKASIELLAVDSTHPSYPLEGSNNIILITTERYNEQPMVIKGYGAGTEVTAAGVFADIIRIANV